MREFLEDAIDHRDDGYGRAQKSMQVQHPKRFYKKADAVPVDGGFAIHLDGRPTKTPGKIAVLVPTQRLGVLMASEWTAQGEHIEPETMPVVRLINSAMEGGVPATEALQAEIVKYASSDLLLYRADTPSELVAKQEASWDTVLVAVARKFGVRFLPTVGVMHQEQPVETLQKLGDSLEGTEFIELTALVSITSITGSGILAIALREGLVSPDEAWTAAHIDEDYNMKLWGEDAEALARKSKRRVEYDAALKVLEALKP